MDISILDILGPVMIGPSSSHTAGAARLARTARAIAGTQPEKVRFGLTGSFAKTGVGHGTHQALLAGALGLLEDDERICNAEELAKEQNVQWEFYESLLEDVHENTVEMTFSSTEGQTTRVVGCSVGGGRILITEIDGIRTEITAETPTLFVTQNDRPGVVSDVSRLLAGQGINIGVMRVSRTAKGDLAACVIETDAPVPAQVADKLKLLPNVRSVQAITL